VTRAETRPTRWPEVRLIAEREIGEKLRSRTFLISTLFFLAIVVASIALPALLADDGPPEYDVAAVGAPAKALVEQVPAEQLGLTVREAPDAEAAERLLAAEDVEAAVEVGADGLVVTALRGVPGELEDALAGTYRLVQLQDALQAAGASDEQVTGLLAPPPVTERLLDEGALAPELTFLLNFVFAMLFFFVVFQFGFSIAQGVVQEKESRIVELLVSAVPIRTLLAGKVLGNGALALVQIVLLAVVSIVGAVATGERELTEVLLRNAGWFLLFFMLGFVMLSCLWAAAGAFASRTEDLQATTTPLSLLVLLPLFASIYTPDGPLRTAMSYFPLTSPLVMPSRLVAGDASAWEATVSVLLLLAAAVVAVLVGERLYRSSLLRTSGRTSLREAWSNRISASL
jgi:ABC-2 type transport system permease protein